MYEFATRPDAEAFAATFSPNLTWLEEAYVLDIDGIGPVADVGLYLRHPRFAVHGTPDWPWPGVLETRQDPETGETWACRRNGTHRLIDGGY